MRANPLCHIAMQHSRYPELLELFDREKLVRIPRVNEATKARLAMDMEGNPMQLQAHPELFFLGESPLGTSHFGSLDRPVLEECKGFGPKPQILKLVRRKHLFSHSRVARELLAEYLSDCVILLSPEK